MAKFLKDIVKSKSSRVKNDLGGYKPKAGDEQDFVAKHKIEKHEDRVGNGDDVYKGTTKEAPYKRQTKVSEEIELDEISKKLALRYRGKSLEDTAKRASSEIRSGKKDSDSDRKEEKRSAGRKLAHGKAFNIGGKMAKVSATGKVDEEVELDEGMKLVKTHKNGNRAAKVYKDTEWDEFRVKHYINNKHQSKADYHTDDSDDAHSTAKHFISKAQESIQEGNKENKAKKKAVMTQQPKPEKKSDFDPREMISALRRGRVKEDTEIDEAAYSYKAARAGKDIGKKGKTFSKIAKSAAERYGSEEKGKKVAGAVLANIRAKHGVKESSCNHSHKGVRCEVHGDEECPSDDKKKGRRLLIDKKKVNESIMNEVAPPDPKIEKWINANKERFIKQYGEKKGKEVLYATAWKKHGRSESGTATNTDYAGPGAAGWTTGRMDVGTL